VTIPLLLVAWLSAVHSASSIDSAEIAGAKYRAATARLSPVEVSDLPPALRSYLRALHGDMRAAKGHPAGSAQSAQDCMAYALAYERALRLLPSRAPNRDIWDALRLGPDCGAQPPPTAEMLGMAAPWPPTTSADPDAHRIEYFVAPNGSDASNGTSGDPFATIGRAVAATRAARDPGSAAARIVLRSGVHVLSATVDLDARDSNLTITAFPGESVWVSGGAPLTGLHWKAVNVSHGANVWAARVPKPPTFMTGLNTVGADGSPTKRLFRAQYPNFNPEWHATSACGGKAAPECARLAEASPFLQVLGSRLTSAGRNGAEASGGAVDRNKDGVLSRDEVGVQDPGLLQWVKPAPFGKPETYFRDLKGEGLKNDSAMVHPAAHKLRRLVPAHPAVPTALSRAGRLQHVRDRPGRCLRAVDEPLGVCARARVYRTRV
jgi:hypothetical protein